MGRHARTCTLPLDTSGSRGAPQSFPLTAHEGFPLPLARPLLTFSLSVCMPDSLPSCVLVFFFFFAYWIHYLDIPLALLERELPPSFFALRLLFILPVVSLPVATPFQIDININS